MLIKKVVRRFLNNYGFDIAPFPSLAERRLLNYLGRNNIGLCLDVGANTGQFGERLKKVHFAGKLYSFEPQSSAFEQLKIKTREYSRWEAFHFALGNFDGTTEINIAQNSVSSSILPILERHEEAEPTSKYISTEQIEIKKLDSLIGNLIGKDEKLYLKIDTQGFEEQVLQGAAETLKNVYVLQMEMSCIELYQGEVLFTEMKKRIEDLGFRLCSIENNFANEGTGELLQVETIFIRA